MPTKPKKTVPVTLKSKLHDFATKRRHFLGGTVLEYVIVTAVFTFLTCVFTNWLIFNISHQIFVEGPGDGTSGFLWLNYADNDLNPLPGHTNLVNYPEGVDLSNPTFVTYTTLWVPLWILSHVFSPLVSLNLVMLWGLMGSGIAMYWLVKRLTNNVWVSFLAGFAVAFVPYHMANSSAHLSYIFSINFVFIAAAFIAFWRRQTWRRAVLLAGTLGFAYYTDGYFLLLATGMIGTLYAGGLVYDFLNRKQEPLIPTLLRKLKYSVLAGVMLGIFMIPIIATQLHHGSEVNSTLAQARSDIRSEIDHYAARPLDYLFPPLRHSIWQNNHWVNSVQHKRYVRSNASENTLYIGYTLLGLCAIGTVTLIRHKRNPKKGPLSRLNPVERRTYITIAVVTLVSIPLLYLCSLGPKWTIDGRTILYMPAALLTHFDISFWRVMARFFLPLHVLLTLFAALSLWMLFQSGSWNDPKTVSRVGRHARQAAVVFLLVGLLSVEYITGFNKPAYDFNTRAPAYTWLKQQKDVKAVVEFPLVGKPWDPATLAITYQLVHHKPLINEHFPQQDAGRRNGLVSIANPEAIDYAAHRGAQIAVTHKEACNRNLPWLKLAYDGSKDKGYARVCMYYIRQASTDNYFANLKSGFADAPLIVKDDWYGMLYGNYAELWVMSQNDDFITQSKPADLSMTLLGTPKAAPFTGNWRILQDEREIVGGRIEKSQPAKINVSIDASQPIQLRINADDGSDPAVNQLSLTDIVITEQ